MRSDAVTKGMQQDPHRSLFHALGLTEEEMNSPLVGIVSSYNEIVPGHMNLDKIVEAVKMGVSMAGGTPIVFPAIVVCDGIAMGHIGMKYSLVTRDLIADSTEAMAMAVAEGVKGKGAEVSVITAAEFSPEQVGEYSAIAFGCPSMGSEQLEESEFEPMFTACEGRLSGKNIALFGSYGWGDGEWMRSWESRCNDDGATLACESVLCNEAPDDDALAACR